METFATDTQPSTSHALARRSPYEQIREITTYLDDLAKVANTLCKATVLPKEMQNPANLQLVLMQGLAMGFDIIQSIRASFIIPPKGEEPAKVGYYVDALVALVRQSKVCRFFRVDISSARVCRVVCARKDEPDDVVHTFELTLEQAQESGLDKRWFKDRGQWACEVKYNWQANPADMLNARTCGRACKRVFQDVVYGMTTPEDLEDLADREVLGTSTPEFVAAPPRDAKPANVAPASSPAPHQDSAGATSPAAEEEPAPAPAEGTGDRAWDELVAAIAPHLKCEPADVLLPQEMRDTWDKAVAAAKDRTALNALGPCVSEASKRAGKSKACAELASHMGKSFNDRNAALRAKKVAS